MGNMSYCRFGNTATDLSDCYENWNEDEENLSEEEKRGKAKILRLCKRILGDYSEEDE